MYVHISLFLSLSSRHAPDHNHRSASVFAELALPKSYNNNSNSGGGNNGGFAFNKRPLSAPPGRRPGSAVERSAVNMRRRMEEERRAAEVSRSIHDLDSFDKRLGESNKHKQQSSQSKSKTKGKLQRSMTYKQ